MTRTETRTGTKARTGAGIAAIVIGRNEGARLLRGLASMDGQVALIIYVDSGSTDGSVEAAHAAGAEVVEIDMSLPFTAARARNAGLARLRDVAPETGFVQFIDGDCALREGWIETAHAALVDDPDLAVVCGRRRERFPDASLWNRMVDAEWDTPIGDAKACGGDALMRMAALEAVGGYRDDLIAGEEPEMCFRMRNLGWRIRRIEAEMTWHDAALTRFGQWWRRSQRAGHAFGEGAALHGQSPERYRMREVRRALVWGLGLPVLLLFGLLITPWALVLVLVWPLQMVRLRIKGYPWSDAIFMTLGKFPEAQGIVSYWVSRLRGRKRGLIEYK